MFTFDPTPKTNKNMRTRTDKVKYIYKKSTKIFYYVFILKLNVKGSKTVVQKTYRNISKPESTSTLDSQQDTIFKTLEANFSLYVNEIKLPYMLSELVIFLYM
jgi:hypothetical protein